VKSPRHSRRNLPCIDPSVRVIQSGCAGPDRPSPASASHDKTTTTNLVSIRVITDHIARPVAFSATITGVEPVWADDDFDNLINFIIPVTPEACTIFGQ
jgi:hypothetical protein